MVRDGATARFGWCWCATAAVCRVSGCAWVRVAGLSARLRRGCSSLVALGLLGTAETADRSRIAASQANGRARRARFGELAQRY